MPRLRRALTAVPTALVVPALVAGLVLAGASSASAATEKHTDPAKDSVAAAADPGTYEPNPQKFGDVVGLVTKHEGPELTITTSYRSIGESGVVLIDRIVTPDDDYTVQYDSIFGNGTPTLGDQTGSTVDCPNLLLSVSAKRDTITVVVPRSCLGRPATVRTGSLTFVPRSSSRAQAGTKLITPAFDDARRKGTIRNTVKVGPKVTHN